MRHPPSSLEPPRFADDVVLAATERAVRHGTTDESGRPKGALWQDILDHLGHGTADCPTIPLIIDPTNRLKAAGLIQTTGRHWTLTATGEAHLATASKAGAVALPESPQHRRWREARESAFAQIDDLFDDLLAEMESTADLFDCDLEPHSDDWFRAAERLRTATWSAASATHCLYEWPEPDEEGGPDVDTHCEIGDDALKPDELAARQRRRSGRRSYTQWRR
jgi:hypothetical protein